MSEVEINPGKDEVMVKIASCGLCNWELNHWKGILGKCPQSLGHEWAGTVVEVGSDVKDFNPGDFITVLPDRQTGFSEYSTADRKYCFKLDSNVNLQHALGEPLKCVVTVVRAAVPEAGDHGVVIGCGFMGLCCIQSLAGKYLSSLTAIDVNDEKLKIAAKFGVTHVINPMKENVKQRLADITGGNMADFVIEGTGVPNLLNSAIGYLRSSGRGRLILMSSHESACKEFDFREAMTKGIEIKVPHPAYCQNYIDNMRRTIAYLNNGTFMMDEIITHRFSLDGIQKAFETLELKPIDYIKGIVIP